MGSYERKIFRHLPSAIGNISCNSSRYLRTKKNKWSQSRLTSLMATCSLLYRFFPSQQRVNKWVILMFFMIRQGASKPLKRHSLYKTNRLKHGCPLRFVPSRSSPKFPHPIFLPTRKFGPTIITPEPDPELFLGECKLPLEGREAFLSRSRSLSLSRLDCISTTAVISRV